MFIGQLFFVLLASWFLVIYFRLWEPYEKPKLKTFIYFLTSHHIQEKKSRCHCITSRTDWGLVNMTITETDVHPLYYRYLSTKSLYRVVNEREQPASHSHLTDKKKTQGCQMTTSGSKVRKSAAKLWWKSKFYSAKTSSHSITLLQFTSQVSVNLQQE